MSVLHVTETSDNSDLLRRVNEIQRQADRGWCHDSTMFSGPKIPLFFPADLSTKFHIQVHLIV